MLSRKTMLLALIARNVLVYRFQDTDEAAFEPTIREINESLRVGATRHECAMAFAELVRDNNYLLASNNAIK